ncbi:MAG: hypothetical protein JKY40_10450 [Gammaproteobacteria bacterium]|nr:hypothetical protein [Gammaproteobacteria bacterium]MBL4729705.1 hypothetical protein [Gammaproteobacteria bacterium]
MSDNNQVKPEPKNESAAKPTTTESELLTEFDSALNLIGEADEKRIKEKPPEFERRFDSEKRRGAELFFHKGTSKEAMRDTGDKILVHKDSSRSVAEEAATLADSKGWTHINVKGNQDFRQKVWEQATMLGINVDGYKPSQEEVAAIDAKLNSIEGSTTDRTRSEKQDLRAALSEAYLSEDKAAALEKYPELKPLYKLESSAQEFADNKITDPDSKASFVSGIRDRGLDEIANGKKLPEIAPTPIVPLVEKSLVMER